MLEKILDFGGILLPIVFGLILFIILITVCWKKVPQDKAAVITGFTKRIITGKAGLVRLLKKSGGVRFKKPAPFCSFVSLK